MAAIYSTFWDANGGWFNHWFRLTDPNFGDAFDGTSGLKIWPCHASPITLTSSSWDATVASTELLDAHGGWFGHWFRV